MTDIASSLLLYQQAFRLMDWDIRYDPAPPEDNEEDAVLATVDPCPSERIATIRVHPGVTDEQMGSTIVHELMHLVIYDYDNLVNNVLSKMGDARLGVMDVLDEYKERICSQVANAMTGVIYEPVGEKARKTHAPFVNHSIPDTGETK